MGHVVNPTTFRLGRSIFWKNNLIYTNYNFRLLKRKNFLFRFIIRVVDWFFREKFSLNFFYRRYKVFRKTFFVQMHQNLKNIFIFNTYNYIDKLLKSLIFSKNKILFNIFTKETLASTSILFLEKIRFFLFKITKNFKFNGLFTSLFNFFFFKKKENLLMIEFWELINQISVVQERQFKRKDFKIVNDEDVIPYYIEREVEIPQYVMVFQYLIKLKLKYAYSNKFKIFSYAYCLQYTNKLTDDEKGFLKIFKCLFIRLRFFLTYSNLLKLIHKRIQRKNLRFFTLEVVDLQLFITSNKIKINIILFKDNLFTKFYNKRLKQFFENYFFNKKIIKRIFLKIKKKLI